LDVVAPRHVIVFLGGVSSEIEWYKARKKIPQKIFTLRSPGNLYGDNKNPPCNRGRDPL